MSLQEKQQIAEELRAFMSSRNLNNTEMSNISGVADEYIGEILKPGTEFKYNAGKGNVGLIPAKWFKILREVMGNQADKELWKTVPTSQMKGILATLEDAKEFGYTRIIIGQTGCGKTYFTDKFINASPKDSFKITVGSMDNISDLLDKILDTLKLPHAKTRSKKIKDIINALKQRQLRDEKPILIFDEAEYMKQATLCNIKELHDHLNKYVAIVLIGTNQLLEKLDILKKKNKPGMPQFYRRIKFGIRELSPIDTQFKGFLNEVEDSEFVRFLQNYCDNYGELHDALLPVKRESLRTGEPMTERFARKVLQLPNNTR